MSLPLNGLTDITQAKLTANYGSFSHAPPVATHSGPRPVLETHFNPSLDC